MARLGERQDVMAQLRERLEQPSRLRSRRRLVRPPSPWRWVPLVLVLALGLTIVQVGSAALDHFVGPRIDQPCATHQQCGGGEHCLMHLPLEERYCTRSCDASAPCPDSMRCGDLAAIPIANRGVGAAGAAAASSACVR